MIKHKELELLLDIQKLIKKYGVSTFSSLVKNLKNEEFVSSIELLAESTSLLKQSKTNNKKPVDYNEKINSILSEIKKEDVDKYNLLIEVINHIDKKDFFMSLKDFSDYLYKTSIYKSKLKTWVHGKYILISHFSKQRTSDITFGIKHIVENQQDTSERSLDAWSSMILSEEKKS